MNWMTRWWKKAKPIARSKKADEPLTEDECRIIVNSMVADNVPKCPDCGGRLLNGPQGGLAVNCCCEQCHSEFNLTFIGNAVLGERISDVGPREVGDRAWCYGL